MSVESARIRTYNAWTAEGHPTTISGEETLANIAERWLDDDPFYFIRITDGDKQIMKQTRGLQKRFRYHRAAMAKGGHEMLEIYEAECPALRQALFDACALVDDNFQIHSCNGVMHVFPHPLNEPCKAPKCPDHYNRSTDWNVSVFSNGLLFTDIFIPWLKKTLHQTKNAFLGPDFCVDDELFLKTFNLTNVHVMPKQAWFHLDQEWDTIRELASTHDAILAGVGFSSTPIGHRLFLEGFNIKFLDVGAIADFFAEKYTRRWIKSLRNPDFIGMTLAELKEVYAKEFL